MAADEKVFSGRLKLKNLQIQSLQSLTDCSKRLRIADRSCHELALDSAVLVMSTRVRRQVSRLLRPPSQIVKKITAVRCELPGRYVGMSANMDDRALLKTRA
jgi:hypothetical protein